MTVYQYLATVDRVWDGDSIHFTVDLGFHTYQKIKTRLYGVDCPELGTEEGTAAKEFVKALLPEGATVTIATFKNPGDKYGRWLAKVELPDGADLADEIISEGHGVPYFGGPR